MLNVCAADGGYVAYDTDTVIALPNAQEPLPCLEGVVIAHDSEVRISLCNRKKDVLHVVIDPLLPFLCNIAVGEFGLYFVVDLNVGTSIAYQIEYGDSTVSFTEISRFESDGVPSTIVLDRTAICATAHGVAVVLWHVWTGIIHRRLNFETTVTAISADSAMNCFLVATIGKLFYINVNGDVLCDAALESGVKFVVSRFVGLPISGGERGAFCGTADGGIWLVSPSFASKRIETQRLASLHEYEIRRLILHRRKGGMLSVDVGGVVCAWTCAGESKTPRLKPDLFVPVAPSASETRVKCKESPASVNDG
jgi:hypothetical protein